MGELRRFPTGNLPKVALFGSTGMVGSDFQGDMLRPHIDATKLDVLKWYLKVERPKYVINAIGMPRFCDTDPYKCNQLNVVVPMNLIMACNLVGSKLIHFSTTLAGDYNLYARSKAYADYLVSTFCKNYAIVKIGWMFGLRNDQGFVKTTIDCIKQNKPLYVYDETGVTSYTVDVARFILSNLSSLEGTSLVGNTGVCSKEELAKEILKYHKSDIPIIKSVRTEAYKQDSYEQGQLRDWREALGACLCDRESLHRN